MHNEGSHDSPLETPVVKGMANLTTHSKYLTIVVEPVTGYSEHIAMTQTYGILKPGTGKINVCLRNHSARQVTLPRQTTVEEIAPADIVPAPLDQKSTGHGGKRETTIKKKE